MSSRTSLAQKLGLPMRRLARGRRGVGRPQRPSSLSRRRGKCRVGRRNVPQCIRKSAVPDFLAHWAPGHRVPKPGYAASSGTTIAQAGPAGSHNRGVEAVRHATKR